MQSRGVSKRVGVGLILQSQTKCFHMIVLPLETDWVSSNSDRKKHAAPSRGLRIHTLALSLPLSLSLSLSLSLLTSALGHSHHLVLLLPTHTPPAWTLSMYTSHD